MTPTLSAWPHILDLEAVNIFWPPPISGSEDTKYIFGGCQDFVKFEKTGTVKTGQNINFMI
jgi:hypothetical protein